MPAQPRVTLGVIQFGNERNLTPVVCLDCNDYPAARRLADFLLQVQNGDRTTAGQQQSFTAGDIAIKVTVTRHPLRPKEAVLAAVWVRLQPTHITEGFFAAATIEADPAELFRFMQQTVRHFVLTVGVQGQPYCDLLYLLKYNLVWRSPIEAAPV